MRDRNQNVEQSTNQESGRGGCRFVRVLAPAAVVGALVWLFLTAGPQAVFAQAITEGAVTGGIQAIDPKARTITLKLELTSRTFQIANDAKIYKKKSDKSTVNDELGTLADFKVGDVVVVKYDEQKEGAIIKEIAPQKPSPGEGG